MRGEVARDLSDSAYDFKRVVWPAIRDRCGGGELQPVEAVSPGEFERKLDVLAGIDAWQIINDRGIRGISSRIQWLEDNPDGTPAWWETFTIRKSRPSGAPTEWQKRTSGINNNGGFISPALIVHAYIGLPRRHGALNYVCMTRSDDLFALATDEMEGAKYNMKGKAWYLQGNPSDGVKFAVFEVAAMRKLGVDVRTECPASAATP